MNSDIIHNVAAPPDPKLFPDGLKTDWIKPGRAVWSYLDGTDSTPEGQKEMARLASELGFEYIVLEGFWRSSWSEAQLRAPHQGTEGPRIGIPGGGSEGAEQLQRPA